MLFRITAAILMIVPCLDGYAETPAFEVQEEIVYSTVDEKDLLLDAFVPTKEGAHPAVLVVHGGAWRTGNRKQLRGYANALAERGFVCFAIDYRLAPDHKFPAQIEDCRAAVKFIRDHAGDYKVDPARLGAIGYSAGGHLVSLLATTGEPPSEENGNVDTRIQVCAAGGAPTDFRWFPDNGNWAEYWMGGNLESAKDNFHDASSAAFADADDAPVFFFNGSADRIVPLMWTKKCYTALKSAGVKTELYTIEDASHMQAAADQEALEKAYAFLQTELIPTEVELVSGDGAEKEPVTASEIE
ncbi:MAG: alpha/beta fold hydrolase [Rubripirellula sp.]